ncbi:MAG: hypothetical protein FH751_14205 [Firmicutes bacterium]|nr:hypothetical protein [Bacillota bacterium]
MNKRNVTNLVIIIVFIILSTGLLSCSNDDINNLDNKEEKTEKNKTFHSIALKYYDNKKFDALWIDNFIKSKNFKIRYGNNENEITKLINYFKSFKYLEISEENLPKNYSEKFEIRFKNGNSDRLEIEILDKTHLKIGLHYLKEIKNESKNVIEIKENKEHIICKIQGELDYNFIKTIFKKLKNSGD